MDRKELTNMGEWYNNLTYSEAKIILEDKLEDIKISFIAAGYFMKYIRDKELYKEDGYQSIWEFAEANYGIQRPTASRWMAINDKFSKGGNSPILAEEYKYFEKSQLQEMLYLEDEQLSKVTPDMTVKEIRDSRKSKIQEEPLSILGYARRTYPEGSLIATAGCGTHDCYSCHQEGCEIRQEDCHCVEATCGSPFPCTTLHVVESIRQDIGNECQFVNKDLAFHRAGDGQPVPCCKRCDNPCGYRCNRAMKYQKKEEQEKMCDVAQDTKSSCPPGQSSCTREHWGTTKEEQEAGEKECKKCWDRYKKRNQEEPCATSHTVCEENTDVVDAEYREVIQEEHQSTMLTFLVEACIEEFDFEEACKDVENRGTFQDWVHDEIFAMIVPFSFEGTEYEAEFLGEIAITKADTGEETDITYTWQEFFEELEHIGKMDEKYAEESQEDMECNETYNPIAIRDYLEEEERTLAEYERVNQEDGGMPHNLMMRQRMLVKALKLLLEHETESEDQEETDEPKQEQTQPELPKLRNNDQRKEFIDNYESWKVWIDNKETGERYYRYDFDNGDSFVVKVYFHKCFNYMSTAGGSYESRYKDRYGSEEYYLLKEGKYFKDCLTNKSQLIEHLKNLQKVQE